MGGGKGYGVGAGTRSGVLGDLRAGTALRGRSASGELPRPPSSATNGSSPNARSCGHLQMPRPLTRCPGFEPGATPAEIEASLREGIANLEQHVAHGVKGAEQLLADTRAQLDECRANGFAPTYPVGVPQQPARSPSDHTLRGSGGAEPIHLPAFRASLRAARAHRGRRPQGRAPRPTRNARTQGSRRSASTRSSARSGDSGDDPGGSEPPPSSGRRLLHSQGGAR